MRIVAKIGGAQLEQGDARAELATSVRRCLMVGHQVVLVHGGGNQIRSWSRRLGIEDQYRDGLRVTDADTAEVATAVLAGLVNKQLVRALEDAGVRAVGLSGADGSTFAVDKHTPDGADLGFVGRVRGVRGELLAHVLEAHFVPVLATVAPLAPDAPGDHSRLYNVNADMAACPLAEALDADALLLLTDVRGVRDEDGSWLQHITPAVGRRLRDSGALGGGMAPKVAAALEVAERDAVRLVKIAPAAGDNALLDALSASVGTVFGSGHPEPSVGDSIQGSEAGHG